jgi:hypothetical protein
VIQLVEIAALEIAALEIAALEITDAFDSAIFSPQLKH